MDKFLEEFERQRRLEEFKKLTPLEQFKELMSTLVESSAKEQGLQFVNAEVIQQVYENLMRTEEIKKIYDALEREERQALLFKHLRRNDMKDVIPLSSVIGGLPREEKEKYIEHIYYNWARLNEKYEKLQEELELYKEESLSFQRFEHLVTSKQVNYELLLSCKVVEDYNLEVDMLWNDPKLYNLTEEEFDFLKSRYKG